MIRCSDCAHTGEQVWACTQGILTTMTVPCHDQSETDEHGHTGAPPCMRWGVKQ